MNKRFLAAVVFVAAAAVSTAGTALEQTSIKRVMVEAHKQGLLKRVVSGKATGADQRRLLALYAALTDCQPPRGSAVSWRRRTRELVDAAQAVVDNEAGAAGRLGRTVNCRACHRVHKGR